MKQLGRGHKRIYRYSHSIQHMFENFSKDILNKIDSAGSRRRNELLFYDIIETNNINDDYNKFIELYNKYKSSKNQYEKLTIRRGTDAAKHLENLYKSKPPNIAPTLSITFWLNKGYSQEDAEKRVEEIRRKNSESVKRSYETGKRRKTTKKDMPWCAEYWLNKGHTKEESKILKQQYLDESSMIQSKNRFISKYGNDIGTKKFNDMISKRQITCLKNNGTLFSLSGHTSKESLRFLLSLYKRIRKIGISKDDVVWGIGKRKEFCRTDDLYKRTYFYDFVIKSLKIVVEYNNTFWHARNEEDWNNRQKNINFISSKMYDERKKAFIEQLGYKVIVVWNDEDKERRISEVINDIQHRRNIRNGLDKSE